MSCNWVRERPRLKNKMDMISYELAVLSAAAVSTLLTCDQAIKKNRLIAG